jgi:esterase/lipase superfamily enzyme
LLVAPDVDVDVFRTQIQRMGTSRPRFALFVSQDDRALSLSQFIWGGMQRLGDINPEQEPYRDILAQEQITVFDLTKMEGNNGHNRAFDDITQVVVMVRERLNDEPVVTSGRRVAGARPQ